MEALKARERKKRIGSIGAGARSSQATNAASSDQRRRSARPSTVLRRPAELCAADDAVDDAEQAEPAEREAGQVELVGRAVGLAQAAAGERGEHEADRHVEPEDPVPGDAVDDGAADERAERDAEAGDARPGADREAALLGRERGGEQRQRERRDDRGAGALQRAGGDQRAGRSAPARRRRRRA